MTQSKSLSEKAESMMYKFGFKSSWGEYEKTKKMLIEAMRPKSKILNRELTNEPIRQGKGWRSLTSKRQMRANMAEAKFNYFKSYGVTLTQDVIMKILGFNSSEAFLYFPVKDKEVSDFYRISGKYGNNFKVK